MSPLIRLFVFCCLTSITIAGPKVSVVIGPSASSLEKTAAERLASDFKSLFDADVTIGTDASGASNIVLVGTPQSNPAIAGVAVESKQRHLIKSTPKGLVVTGGSPVAVLWAASELSYQLGIRHLLLGDVMPVEKPAFHLDGFDLAFDSLVEQRAWSMFNGTATGGEAWTKEDITKLFAQLAKLKFTNVVVPASIADVPAVAVDGDTAGRKAFGGAKQFPAAHEPFDIRAQAQAAGLEVLSEGRATLALGATNSSALPQFSMPRLSEQWQAALSKKSFIASASMPGDLNATTHFVSRASFDAKVTPEQSLRSLVEPICGEGVAERLQKGFDAIAQATKLIEANDAALGVPDATLIKRHLESKAPLPSWITDAKALYATAMNEMYRANTRAREGARTLTLYHAKRLEFTFHFFSAIESLYKAHDAAAKDESIEAAVESLYNSLNSLSDVAANASDRGAIALINQHGLRVLTQSQDK